jgi:hypothetical protein
VGNTQLSGQPKREKRWTLNFPFFDHPLAWESGTEGSVDLEKLNAVLHRGHVYPKRFDATWTREDGLQVILDIAVDEDRGPIPMSVTITGPDGVTGEYRQPIQSMVRGAAATMAFSTRGGHYRPTWGNKPVPMGPPARRTDTARLQRVADLYHQAIEEGEPVGEFIAEEEYVTRKTAYGLIRRARKAGLLPPSPPGRKAQTDD